MSISYLSWWLMRVCSGLHCHFSDRTDGNICKPRLSSPRQMPYNPGRFQQWHTMLLQEKLIIITQYSKWQKLKGFVSSFARLNSSFRFVLIFHYFTRSGNVDHRSCVWPFGWYTTYSMDCGTYRMGSIISPICLMPVRSTISWLVSSKKGWLTLSPYDIFIIFVTEGASKKCFFSFGSFLFFPLHLSQMENGSTKGGLLL